MTVTAIVPLKALARAKGRLAGELGRTQRLALVTEMFRHVVAVVTATPGVAEVVAVVGDGGAADLADGLGVPWLLDPGRGLNAAIEAATHHVIAPEPAGPRANPGAPRRVRAATASASLVVVADLPELTIADVSAVVTAGNRHGTVVVASTLDGGTGALLRRPVDAIAPRFGVDSAAAHLDAAQVAGHRAVLLRTAGLALDLDRPADLRRDAERGGPAAPIITGESDRRVADDRRGA